MGYSYGHVRPKYKDPRDRFFSAPRRVMAALPPAHDLSQTIFRTVPQLDQGQLGSCGPNTAFEDIVCDEIADNAATLVGPSRLFIYYETRRLMGTIGSDSGVDNRSMMKALAASGYCPESMCPYNDGPQAFRVKPSQACYAAAISNRIIGYSAVPVVLEQIKAALIVTGRPVVFGIELFQGMEGSQATETGIVPNPLPGQISIGGHDVSVVGWDDNRRLIKFRNHWMKAPGVPWGDGGYGYFSYDYAVSPHASDLWTIDAVAGPVIPPTPPVPPTPTPAPADWWNEIGDVTIRDKSGTTRKVLKG